MARQDGVITRTQALGCDMSSTSVGRAVATGEWTTLAPGVYLRSDRERTDAVELRAAVYGAGQEAVAWGPSAAWWHGLLERPPARHYVTVPHHRIRSCTRTTRVRRRDLHWKDTAVVRSLPLTALPSPSSKRQPRCRVGRCSWTGHFSGTPRSRFCSRCIAATPDGTALARRRACSARRETAGIRRPSAPCTDFCATRV